MLIALISDTHLPRGSRALPEACLAHLRAADLIVHAGDISTAAVLKEIEDIGPPVAAVYGNQDEAALARLLPEVRTIDADGAKIAVIHDAGARTGRLNRMRKRFPDAQAVVFGHSHIPLHETTPDNAFQIFNPGSPTDKRRQPRHTMGLARARAGSVDFELIELD